MMEEASGYAGPAGGSGKFAISEEQRARISDNYRAAKALLDRKRNGKHPPPSPTSPTSYQSLPKIKKLISDKNAGFERDPTESRCKPNMMDKLSEVGRVPLQEINSNTCRLPLFSSGFTLVSKWEEPKYRMWLTPCNMSSIKVQPDKINDFEEAGVPVSTNDSQSPSFPLKNYSEDHHNNKTSVNLLVEEFDDSFLQEIDTIVGQKYSRRTEKDTGVRGGCPGWLQGPCNEFERHIFDEVGPECLLDATDLSVQATILFDSPRILAAKETELVPHDFNSECINDPLHVLAEKKPDYMVNEVCSKISAGQSASKIRVEDSVAKSHCEQMQALAALSDGSGEESGSQNDQNYMTDDSFAKYLQSLNDMQREAVTTDITVPLMIVAGPGSGKTSTIVGRVLMLLKEGIAPSNILAMTFTTAAASEMRERIGTLAGKAIAKELVICTFHSFCLQLCRSHPEKLERTADFLIYGTAQQRRAVTEAVRLTEMSKTAGKDSTDQYIGEDSSHKAASAIPFKDKSKKWQKFIAMAKASGKTVEDYQKMGCDLGAKILEHYNEILKSCNALDYYDFISSSLKLLSNFPEVHKHCKDSWKAIVVDEFQDTSTLQYQFLRVLASHNHITVVGDEDQSIYSFNGADISGFNAFRKDFPFHKEVRLQRNYRSTRSIVEASLALIQHNSERCHLKQVVTDNDPGSKISVVECHSEDAQCSFVIDKILEMTSDSSADKCYFGNISVLYRRQVSGKLFQTSFRSRKIPFNVHGVAFYRKKVTKAIIAMLKTALPGCGDGPYRHAFKALFPGEKSEKKMVVDYLDKISAMRKCGFLSTAHDVFTAKVSGTFKRSQLAHGRKVLLSLDVISKLVQREQSLSMVVTSVANLLPQKYLLDQRAVVDADGRKLLNEDSDLRTVLHYLMDDVSEFLSTFCNKGEYNDGPLESKGCVNVLRRFIDHISGREMENFRNRRVDNENSVTLTTIHQSKGLEWDTVFIIKANDSEIPLLHDVDGYSDDPGSVEEERRLLYVAMTRSRKKLYILYVVMDTNWQILQPSRFLKELPIHLLEIQDCLLLKELQTPSCKDHTRAPRPKNDIGEKIEEDVAGSRKSPNIDPKQISHNPDVEDESEQLGSFSGNSYLRRFKMEDRSYVSHLFHSWAKKQAFHDPRRLLDKVGFVIEERLRSRKNKSKDVLQALRSELKCEEAFQYAEYVIRWEQMPADRRMHIMHEKQEHFQKQRIEASMDSSAATSKQISYLQKLGCTVTPTSRLHASRLIEQYKSL